MDSRSKSVFARLLIFVILSFGSVFDVVLLLSVFVHGYRLYIYNLWTYHSNLAPFITYVQALAILSILVTFCKLIRGLRSISASTNDFVVRPMFFPSETKHVRMFPSKHGFTYSYLLAGIPVGYRGRIGGLISVDEKTSRSWYHNILGPWRAWYVVDGDDYLERGHHPQGLSGKLTRFLDDKGIDSSRFTYAYLFTAPRFLNYSSNPVSIWQLYSQTKELAGMILEVNNTFGEKHSYFLEPSATPSSSGLRYAQSWKKDFYVSVFNSRAGSYSIASSTSPLHHHKIDTTITLSDDSGKAMIIARIYSTSPPLDPSTMTTLEKIMFLASWWWVGLATFPRTVVQAFKLLVQKKMPWVFRPEPRRDTISRDADDIEVSIEQQFRLFLQDAVEQSRGDLRISYRPAGLSGSDADNMIFDKQHSGSTREEIDVRILTPLFYSRLVQYPSIEDAISVEVSNGTISCTDSAAARSLWSTAIVRKKSKASSTAEEDGHGASIKPHFHSTTNLLTNLGVTILFVLISTLKTRPAAIAKLPDEVQDPKDHDPEPESSSECRPQATTVSLDTFVLQSSRHLYNTAAQRRNYFWKVLRLVLARRIAFGWYEILDLEVLALKIAVCRWIVGSLP